MSYDLDPPLVDVLHATNALLSELLAVYYNVHRNPDTHEPFTGSDFLRDPDAVDDDDETDEEDEIPDETPVHPAFLSGMAHTNVPLMRGHGAAIPENVWGMFGDGEAGEPED